MEPRMPNTTNDLVEIEISALSVICGGGDINWKNAAAQCGIWGAAGAGGALVTGAAAPAAGAAGLIGCAAGAGSSIASDLLSK
jgi:hypothetical protein